MHQHGVERTKGVYVDDNLKMCETMYLTITIKDNEIEILLLLTKWECWR